MAENETTTRFKVDISELKAGITEANRQIRLANSEFKAATAGMDDWASSTDGVSAKLKQLDSTLDSQKGVLTNLQRQYELTVAEMGEGSRAAQELQIKINNQQAAIRKTESEISRYTNTLSSLQAASDDAGDAADNVVSAYEALSNEIKSQESELKQLQRAYANYVVEGNEASDEARELAQRINDLNSDLDTNRRALNNADDAAEELVNSLDDVGDAADDAGKEASGLGSKLGDLAKNGFAALAGAATAAVGAFFASAESTREYREDIGKLQTAFETAGYSADTAAETYKSFFSVLGEEDRSVEAVNHLAAMKLEQEQLAQWTDICAGVWGTFGDSLPIEGLTEAANETAKVGQVTGPLADALNWAGVSEDEFNESLAACNSEQERAALITDTLNGLYAEAAENYKEVNGDIMEAQRAQSELTDAMAAVGAVAEPIMTDLKLLGATMLTELLPAVEQLGAGFGDMLNGVEGGGEKVGEGISNILTTALDKIMELAPSVIEMGVSLITNLTTGILSALPELVTVAAEIITALLDGLAEALPEIALAIVEIVPKIIDALVAAIPQLIEGALNFWMAIISAIPQLIKEILNALPQIIKTIINGLLTAIPLLIDAAISLFMAIIEAIPEIIVALVEALPQIIKTIITALVTAVPQLIEASITLFMALIDAIPQIIVALVDAIPQIIEAVITALIDSAPQLMEASVTVFMAIVEAIPQILGALVEALGQIISSIFDAILSIGKKIGEWNTELVKKQKETFTEFVNKGVEIIKDLPYKIGHWLGETIAKIIAWSLEMREKAKETAINFVKSLVDFIKDIPNKIHTLLTETIPKVVQWGVDLAAKGKQAAKDLFNNIVETITNLPDKMNEIGENLVTGLWEGIQGMTSWIGDKVSGFVDGVVDGFKSGFDEHSPSKVTRQIGAYVSEGLGLGISDKAKVAVAAARDMVGQIKTAVNGVNDGLGAGVAGNTTPINNTNTSNNNYNFVQNNYSPKSLSRMEIYRQTQNQIALIKGVQHV